MRAEGPVKPDWWLIKLDTRRHWREDIQALTTHIYAVYAFDRNSYTYCCSLTPAYDFNFIDHDHVEIEGLTEEQREQLFNLIQEAGDVSENSGYYNVGPIEQIMKESPHLCQEVTKYLDWEEDDEPPEDQLREMWCSGALRWMHEDT